MNYLHETFCAFGRSLGTSWDARGNSWDALGTSEGALWTSWTPKSLKETPRSRQEIPGSPKDSARQQLLFKKLRFPFACCSGFRVRRPFGTFWGLKKVDFSKKCKKQSKASMSGGLLLFLLFKNASFAPSVGQESGFGAKS